MSLGLFSLIDNLLSVDECREIINSLPDSSNIIPQNNKISEIGIWYKNDITDQRCAIAVDPDILNRIKSHIPNSSNYRAEKMYITKYTAGQFCKAHDDPTDITAIILLNDDFEGGDFFLEQHRIKLQPGDALFFDKRKYHSVSTVTSGTRYALSIWLNSQT